MRSKTTFANSCTSFLRRPTSRIFESYSEYDKELREFRSFDDLSGAFELGSDKHGHGFAVLLQLWSSTVIPNVGFERIALKV